MNGFYTFFAIYRIELFSEVHMRHICYYFNEWIWVSRYVGNFWERDLFSCSRHFAASGNAVPADSSQWLLQTVFVISDVVVQWCTQGDLLAVAGMEKQSQLVDLGNGSLLKSALVKFYNVRGEHIYTLETPVQVGGIF